MWRWRRQSRWIPRVNYNHCYTYRHYNGSVFRAGVVVTEHCSHFVHGLVTWDLQTTHPCPPLLWCRSHLWEKFRSYWWKLVTRVYHLLGRTSGLVVMSLALYWISNMGCVYVSTLRASVVCWSMILQLLCCSCRCLAGCCMSGVVVK